MDHQRLPGPDPRGSPARGKGPETVLTAQQQESKLSVLMMHR